MLFRRLHLPLLLLVAVVFTLPIVAVLASWLPLGAFGGQDMGAATQILREMASTVLPRYAATTVWLAVLVGIGVALVGIGSAALVTLFDFPGRRSLEWLLLLPLAMPAYVTAYAYTDFLQFSGPLQVWMRATFGLEGRVLPEVRSLGGAAWVFVFSLYPYVYLLARTALSERAAHLMEAARLLGAPLSRRIREVALPLARPAIAVGVSLALMETLNDIGASEFLGVRSLTISIYTTWVTRSDLPGAAQISLALVLLVVALVSLERWARRRQHYSAGARRARQFRPQRLHGVRAATALVAGLLPVTFGFLAPALFLAVEAWKRFQFAGLSDRLLVEARNTFLLSAGATVAVLICGLIIAYATRILPHRGMQALQRIASLGYAMPGTVLGLGVLIAVANLDRLIDRTAQDWFGFSTGLLLIGSGLALGYAYLARFLAISIGSVEAGLSRIPRSYDNAARTLGHGPGATLRRIHLPLSRPAIAAAGLLVFVDCMKELSATLMLRPLNFETLATHLYGEAARGTYEEAALAALAIVVVGVLPVILLARVRQGDKGA